MIKKYVYLLLCSLCFVASAQAMGDIDNFVRDHCGTECNGESDDCTQCYSSAVSMFDEENPVSPEYNFDIVNNYGKLEWRF